MAYANDLDSWRRWQDSQSFNRIDDPDWLDDGLYTGETALHIVIVNGELKMLRKLLEKGVSLLSRATGTFFQPMTIRNRVLDPSKEEWSTRLWAWLEGRDLGKDPFAYVSHQTNESSGCYYGESPLSFSASMGNVEACKMLLDEWENRQLYISAKKKPKQRPSQEAAISDKGKDERPSQGAAISDKLQAFQVAGQTVISMQAVCGAFEDNYASLKGLPSSSSKVTNDWLQEMDKVWDPER